MLIFLTTLGIAIISLIAYACFEKKGWFKGNISLPYQGVDCLFCLVLVSYFLTVIATPESDSPLNMKDIQAGTIFYLLLDLLIIAFLLLRRINPIHVFGISKLSWWPVLKAAVLGLLVVYPCIFLVQILMDKIAGAEAPSQPLVRFLADNPSLLDRCLVAGLAVVVAPLTEELIFRGYLYGVIRRYAGRLAAILVTACLFAGIHQHLPAFPGLFLLAIVLSFAYEATGSLLVPILLHMLFNLIGVFAAVASPISF